MTNNPLDPAMDRMSVAPDPRADDDAKGAAHSADAGTDSSIEERLARDPASKEARLDRALDESMDASDPPASTQPVHNNDIPESSGYDAKAEADRAEGKEDKGLIDKALHKLGLD
ncbi:hypothetical protein CA233_18530 [Sphingomonas sp. ABOLD]|uniref:Uncharacterized protein n=1 Tax=Sphingomonas trueperi TaxID=53317 RepID=A0A7X6BD43_9SPHN|nr:MULTISPECIES: hypothetical protein [Sphingomonas]NJB98253.1 hypothetical protein [Sphingomonas trueperi]RSV41308.1 hypothetical protein CA233_18530 [Sphingomonas sp. ABOLD]RSV45506.1 hypothetical protein CA234_01255 [Sphingomonas sp. ABOLE]